MGFCSLISIQLGKNIPVSSLEETKTSQTDKTTSIIKNISLESFSFCLKEEGIWHGKHFLFKFFMFLYIGSLKKWMQSHITFRKSCMEMSLFKICDLPSVRLWGLRLKFWDHGKSTILHSVTEMAIILICFFLFLSSSLLLCLLIWNTKAHIVTLKYLPMKTCTVDAVQMALQNRRTYYPSLWESLSTELSVVHPLGIVLTERITSLESHITFFVWVVLSQSPVEKEI